MVFTIAFLTCLSLTVFAMALTVRSGLQRRRKVHVVRALTTVVLLAVTIVFALLMQEYERALPAREMGIHRIFSMTVACVLPLVAITGILLWHRPAWRWPHRVCVGVLLVATVCAAVTGLWVLALSSAIAD